MGALQQLQFFWPIRYIQYTILLLKKTQNKTKSKQLFLYSVMQISPYLLLLGQHNNWRQASKILAATNQIHGHLEMHDCGWESYIPEITTCSPVVKMPVDY